MDIARDDLNIARGEDFQYGPFTIEIDEVELNLTGASVYAQIRDHHLRTAPKILDFIVDVDTATNEITLSLTDAQTAAVPTSYSSGWYDVLVVDSNNNDTYYLQGKVTFHNTVTVKP